MTERFRILISDPLFPEVHDVLEATGQLDVVEQFDGFEAVLPTIHGWIVQAGTQVTAELLDMASNLRCVCRAGAGVDNIALEAASRRGVIVMNIPGANSRAAAEHAIALMFSLIRHIPFAHQRMCRGEWGREDYVGTQVEGRTIGIVGMGKVGRYVGQMARGLGMGVIAVDPFLSLDVAQELGFPLMSLEEMLPQADFITVHAPLSQSTRGLIDAEALKLCKPGVRIINCGRGGVVDEAALLEAIESGPVAGAALDVYDTEPLAEDSPLRNHPAIVTTPHIGAWTLEAQRRVAIASAEQVRDLLLQRIVTHSVNTPSLAGEERERYAPMAELGERIGSLHAQLLEGSPLSITVELEEQEGIRTVERLVVDHILEGFLKASSAQPVNAVNARYLAEEKGIEVTAWREAQPSDWIRWIGVLVESSEGQRRIEGAVVGRDSLRLVRFEDYQLDAPLEGSLLLIQCLDQPGMIGRIGSLLGDLGLNVANMAMGRDRCGETGLSVFVLDDTPKADALAKIQSLDGVESIVSLHP